jgi:hypothetical protein
VALLGVVLIGGAWLPARLAGFLQATAMIGLVWWVVSPLIGRDDAAGLSIGEVVVLGGVLGMIGCLAPRSAGQAPDLVMPAVLAIALGALGQVLFLFGSASLAQFCGSASLACGGSVVATVGRRALPAAAVVAAVGLGAVFAVDGWAFLDDTPPRASLILLALVPLVPAVTRLRRVRSARPIIRLAFAVGLALVIAGAAVGIAIAERPVPNLYGDAYK